jgi:hypothetical protein
MAYTDELQAKLQAAQKRVRQGKEMKALQDTAPSLLEIIDTEISLAVNRMTGDKPVSYDEYLSLHGQVAGIRRIRNLMDSRIVEEVQASQQVQDIQGTLKQFSDDKKQ